MNATFPFKLTALHAPNEHQECLVYNPCEGFMIATWRSFGDTSGFYLFATYEPLEPEQAPLWLALPSMEERIAFCDKLGLYD